MSLRRRIKVAVLSAVTVATAAVGLAVAASPAHAQSPGPTLLAFGGPQSVVVSGTGFDAYGPNDTVRVTVLTGDQRYDLGQEGNYGSYNSADLKISNGNLTVGFYDLGYTGPVQVYVDDLTTDSTWGAQTTTKPGLQFAAVGQKGCGPQGTYGNYVTATVTNFLPYYTANFELLNQNLTSVLSIYSTTADDNGYATAGPQLLWTGDYQGGAYLVVSESGYGPTAGLPAPYGNIGQGAQVWYHIDLC